MLERLLVKNFALIEHSDVIFGSGLNIITGETGSGKSIFMSALGALMGKKVESASLLCPEEKSIIEATFQHVHVFVEPEFWVEHDLELSDELIVRREISPNGKSRFFLNDSPASQQTVKSLMENLIELHGQHEGQKLLSIDYQLQLLDAYGQHQELLTEYQKSFDAWKQTHKSYEEKKAQASQISERKAFLAFQLEDFKGIELIEGEDDALEEQLKLLENAEQIKTTLEKACFVLYESEKSIYGSLANVEKVLERILNLAPGIRSDRERISEITALISETASNLRDFADHIDTDPQTLEHIQEKLNVYNRLKKKYNVTTVSELIAIKGRLAAEYATMESWDEVLADLLSQSEALEAQCLAYGKALDEQRKVTATALSERVNAFLADVGLVNAEFEVVLKPLANATKRGLSEVRFMVRTNKGIASGALEEVASGGEISRILLAIKSALAEKLSLSTLIFDEIDTGISGEVAMKVGKVIENLAQKFQVIVITHLPQMASRKGKHFQIYKEVQAEKTYSRIRELGEEERIHQVACMLYGDNPPSAAIENAKTLLGLSHANN